jgi:hypothetical protein
VDVDHEPGAVKSATVLIGVPSPDCLANPSYLSGQTGLHTTFQVISHM